MLKKPARFWKNTTDYIISALLLLLFFSCSADQQDTAAVSAVAEARREALVSHNLPKYISLLSTDFHDKGLDYQAKVDQLTETMGQFPKIDFLTENRQIDISGTSATIREKYYFRTTVKGEALNLQGEETLRLRKEPGGWKIISGL